MVQRLIPDDFELNTLDDAVYCLSTLEQRFSEKHDKRAVFATAYLTITKAMKANIEEDRFGDCEWVDLYLRSFIRLYVDALRAHEAGDMQNVPRAWRVALDLCASGDGLVIQHLVLGINAHVNHDLPMALAAAGIDPHRPRRYDDHTSVNLVLGAAIDALQEHVGRLYSPVLRLFDTMFGKLDDELSFSLVKNARENAWQACLDMIAAQNDEEYREVRQRVDTASGELAEMIARPLRNVNALFAAMGSLENHSPIGLLMRRPKPDIYAHANTEILPSLDVLHDHLNTVIEKYDTDSSEMAVYPAFYGLWLHVLSSAVQDGRFTDPDWIIQLELMCARIYLRALADFESGESYEIPHGWVSALYAAYDEEATIPQHMLLSINARMGHDVPMLLRSNAIPNGGKKKHLADLEQWKHLYDTTLETVGANLVRKYRQQAGLMGINVEFPDRLLDLDFLDDVEFITSTEADLASISADPDLQEVAIRAAVRAHEILTRRHISSPDLTAALKQIEAAYTGKWSDWI